MAAFPKATHVPALLFQLMGRTATGALYLVRFMAFSVLAVLEPVVRLGLLVLALLGFTACGIYALLLRDPRFPLFEMLALSITFCVLSALYGVLVHWLARRPH